MVFVTSNRCKFQIKDKRSLLILNVQNIVFNVVKICVFEIFLSVPNRAYHVSSSRSNLPSFLCPIFLGIFLLLSLYLGEIARLVLANITEISRKSIQVAEEKTHFDTHIDTKNPEISKYVVYNFFVVVSSIVSKKVLNNLYK